MEYIAYLHKDRKSDFGVSFPDFPGCVTAGKTLDEARRVAPEALTLHIEGVIEDGEPPPEPSTLDDLADDPTMKGAVAFLASVDIAEKAERYTSCPVEPRKLNWVDLLHHRSDTHLLPITDEVRRTAG